MKRIRIRRVFPSDTDLDHLVEQINLLLKVLAKDKPDPCQISLSDLLCAVNLNNFALYILELGNEVAGMGSIHYHRTLTKWAAYIEDVVVSPKFQGEGLGRIIVRHLVDQAKEEGVKFVELTSHPRRIPANQLYQKLGFAVPETNLYRLYL